MLGSPVTLKTTILDTCSWIIKLSLQFTVTHEMKEAAVQLHSFIRSALGGSERTDSRPGRLTSGETATGTHGTRGQGVPSADKGSFIEEMLFHAGNRTTTHSTQCSQHTDTAVWSPQIIMTEWWPGSSVGIATGYGLDGPGIECRWGQDFPHLSRPGLGPTQPPAQWVLGLSRGVKSGRGVTMTPHPLLVPLVMKEQSYTSTLPMSRTACTEPQCLYKGDLYLYLNGSYQL